MKDDETRDKEDVACGSCARQYIIRKYIRCHSLRLFYHVERRRPTTAPSGALSRSK
jgi:hypothetical protein